MNQQPETVPSKEAIHFGKAVVECFKEDKFPLFSFGFGKTLRWQHLFDHTLGLISVVNDYQFESLVKMHGLPSNAFHALRKSTCRGK